MVVCPGLAMLIEPAQLHMHVEVLLSVGMLASITLDEPGVQGADVAGIQGIGVSTPSAAEVAAATVGLARLLHMPNGMMFSMGTLSMMFAAATMFPFTMFAGRTVSEEGAVPMVHWS